MNEGYPRTLVFSNNSFSQSNSNGRTLGNLFSGWPREHLAQFAIMCFDPDFNLCDNYFQVKDVEALKALVKGDGIVTGNAVSAQTAAQPQQFGKSTGRKTALKMLLRDAVWDIGRWHGRRFDCWVDDFKPEVVVVQSGDSAFMLRLARRTARRFNAPLIMYNTEGYMFFDHNYLSHHWTDVLAFPIFRWHYRRTFRRTLKVTDHAIYLNGKLEKDYQAYLPHHSDVIYNSSTLCFKPKAHLSPRLTVSYLGNLGIRRPEALAEAARVLQSISPNYHIDVYGNASPQAQTLFENEPGIKYHGSVSYEKVIEIIYASDVVMHVEKNDPILCRELRYAFSTKIADSICSGTDFVVYAPVHLACSTYVRESGAAYHADTPETLRRIFINLIEGTGRATTIENARRATRNHSLIDNAKQFKQIICNATKK